MLAHVFVLILMIDGKVVSADMHFWSIERCNYFAAQMVKRYGRGKIPDEQSSFAYCKPKLVDTSKIKPEVY